MIRLLLPRMALCSSVICRNREEQLSAELREVKKKTNFDVIEAKKKSIEKIKADVKESERNLRIREKIHWGNYNLSRGLKFDIPKLQQQHQAFVESRAQMIQTVKGEMVTLFIRSLDLGLEAGQAQVYGAADHNAVRVDRENDLELSDDDGVIPLDERTTMVQVSAKEPRRKAASEVMSLWDGLNSTWGTQGGSLVGGRRARAGVDGGRAETVVAAGRRRIAKATRSDGQKRKPEEADRPEKRPGRRRRLEMAATDGEVEVERRGEVPEIEMGGRGKVQAAGPGRGFSKARSAVGVRGNTASHLLDNRCRHWRDWRDFVIHCNCPGGASLSRPPEGRRAASGGARGSPPRGSCD
jgi:hypothetical protein